VKWHKYLNFAEFWWDKFDWLIAVHLGFRPFFNTNTMQHGKSESQRLQSRWLSPHLDTLQRIQMLCALATLLVRWNEHTSIHGDSDRGHG